jgi:hypothetical protein
VGSRPVDDSKDDLIMMMRVFSSPRAWVEKLEMSGIRNSGSNEGVKGPFGSNSLSPGPVQPTPPDQNCKKTGKGETMNSL